MPWWWMPCSCRPASRSEPGRTGGRARAAAVLAAALLALWAPAPGGAAGIAVAGHPRVQVSNDESVELFSVLAGAVALVSADDVPAGVKVLKIDGTKPGDATYPL